MFSRAIFTVCALALFIGVTNINAGLVKHRQSQQNEKIQDTEFKEALNEFFDEPVLQCWLVAAKECKSHGYNPLEFIQCTKDYFHSHSDECVISSAQSLDDSIKNNNVIEIIEHILEFLHKHLGYEKQRCMLAAAKECKSHWYNPVQLVQCTNDYIHNHAEECTVSRVEPFDASVENYNAIETIEHILEFLNKHFGYEKQKCLLAAAKECKSHKTIP